MDRRAFLAGVVAIPFLPAEDEVDRIIQRIRMSPRIDFPIPEELFTEIERRSGIVILTN